MISHGIGLVAEIGIPQSLDIIHQLSSLFLGLRDGGGSIAERAQAEILIPTEQGVSFRIGVGG